MDIRETPSCSRKSQDIDSNMPRKRRKGSASVKIEPELEDQRIFTQSPRRIKINNNYINLYKKEVDQFLTGYIPKYCTPFDLKLPTTYINSTGQVGSSDYHEEEMDKLQQIKNKEQETELDDDMSDEVSENSNTSDSDDDDESDTLVNGVRWTPKEKELFFTFLGRRSKHNLKSVADEIPTKSFIEVVTYFNVLNSQTELMKGNFNNENKTYNYRAGMFKRIKELDLEDFPAAVEMSEHWILMEESQAQTWNQKKGSSQRDLISRYNTNTNIDILSDGTISQQSINNNKKSEDTSLSTNLLSIDVPTKLEETEDGLSESIQTSDDSNTSLFNIDTMFNLINSIYCKTGYGEVSEINDIHQDVITELKRITKYITERILAKVLEMDYREKLKPGTNNDGVSVEGEYMYPFIWAADIVKAVDSMKDDIYKEFPISLKRYWADIEKRLNITVKKLGYSPTESHDKYRTLDRSIDYFKRNRISFEDPNFDMKLISSCNCTNNISANKKKPGTEVISIDQLLPSKINLEKRDRIIDDSELDDEDGLELLDIETLKLEALDFTEARSREHTLLVWMSTFENPEILSISEAEDLRDNDDYQEGTAVEENEKTIDI